MTDLYEILRGLTLICTDKNSKFYQCKGYAEQWVHHEHDHILFQSIDKVGGSGRLSIKQFAVTEESILRLENQIEALTEQRKEIDQWNLTIFKKSL